MDLYDWCRVCKTAGDAYDVYGMYGIVISKRMNTILLYLPGYAGHRGDIELKLKPKEGRCWWVRYDCLECVENG